MCGLPFARRWQGVKLSVAPGRFTIDRSEAQPARLLWHTHMHIIVQVQCVSRFPCHPSSRPMSPQRPTGTAVDQGGGGRGAPEPSLLVCPKLQAQALAPFPLHLPSPTATFPLTSKNMSGTRGIPGTRARTCRSRRPEHMGGKVGEGGGERRGSSVPFSTDTHSLSNCCDAHLYPSIVTLGQQALALALLGALESSVLQRLLAIKRPLACAALHTRLLESLLAALSSLPRAPYQGLPGSSHQSLPPGAPHQRLSHQELFTRTLPEAVPSRALYENLTRGCPIKRLFHQELAPWRTLTEAVQGRACLKPCCSCPAPAGPVETVAHEEVGLLCDPTPAAFAAAFRRLLCGDEMGGGAPGQLMGEAAKRRVQAMFSRAAFGRKLLRHMTALGCGSDAQRT